MTLDTLLRAISSDLRCCVRDEFAPRAKMKALKRIERAARHARRITELGVAETREAPVSHATTDPNLSAWISDRLETSRFRRPGTES